MAGGCRGCGGGGAGPSVNMMDRTIAAMRSNTRGVQNMSANDLVMAELIDGNIGTHDIVGVVTKTFYGQRAHGDQFLVHRADLAEMGRKLKFVEPEGEAEGEPEAEEGEPVEELEEEAGEESEDEEATEAPPVEIAPAIKPRPAKRKTSKR